MRRLLIATLLLAAWPATAQAAPMLSVQLANADARYGSAHTLTGALMDGTAALGGQEVVLEGERYPFAGSFRVLAKTMTDASGQFRFKPTLDRNHRLRVVATAQSLISNAVRTYTLPSFELSFRPQQPGVVRLYQRYTVPKTVKLTAPTLFYLGPRGAKTAKQRVAAATRRTSPGHYTAAATVKLPAAWKGAFRFGSCFRTSPHSGMGEPNASCPKLALRL